MKHVLAFLFTLVLAAASAQEYTNVKKVRLAATDSIQLDSISINPSYFKMVDSRGMPVDSTAYKVDFENAIIYIEKFTAIKTDSIDIQFLPLPDFLKKTYQQYDPKIILDNNSAQERVVAMRQSTMKRNYVPFDGLNTTGSITRGLRVGNNQNSVVDSELDLRISGALSDKVSLRASIQDANVPQTQNGYSQRLDEFDQIFIELYSDDWNIRAGDVDLIQTDSYFNNFTKRVQGISGQVNFNGDDSKGYVQAAGALVRGIFNISRFTGQEGNQGPYKLTGRNGELFILVVSGSERVFVNGVPLTRGENADYVIDYNAGEVRFNATFPITSEMRISIEYQYSERNFTRFVGYGKGGYETDKLAVETYIYTESDAKNQPLQQNLNEDQVAILAAAGDNEDLAIAPSAVADAFSENKILYRKETIAGVERFVFSQDPNYDLFNVRFSFVGENQGDYILVNDQAITNIYEYVAPIAGVSQGNFAPVIRLFAPEIITIAGAKARYAPSKTTILDTEIAASSNDLNRFSSIDDDDNRGVAVKLAIQQQLWKKDSLTTLRARVKSDYIDQNFRNVERVYNIEFNRDWNIDVTSGNQLFSTIGLDYVQDSTLRATYELEHLEFSDSYNGNRHNVSGMYRDAGWQARFRGSVLNSNATTLESQFYRANVDVVKHFQNKWIGARFDTEDNQQNVIETGEFTPLSQRFAGYEVYGGIGDSTAVFVEIGYRNRVNDSLRLGNLERVNRSNNYYVRSQPIKDEWSNLRVYANYRVLKSEIEGTQDEVSFNSRLQYQRKFFDKKVLWNTTYETNSSTIPRQDFTYVEVNPGQGTFTWIDYNGDGIQDLYEFEVAQFQDQGRYVRILLPNQIFIPTHQNKFAQTLTLNPISWAQKEGYRKVLSHFYNQTSYLIDRMVAREGATFNLNPFNSSDNQLGLNLNFRNSLFYNRGKQRYTTNYTYISSATENLQSIGSLSSKIESHQLGFIHKIKENWLITMDAQTGFNASESENFANRNFKINESLFKPQISYLFGKSSRVDLFYELQTKENVVNEAALLDQQNLGISFSFNKEQKYAVNGEMRYVKNDFEGQAFSPVGFQMLEGLQPGTNFTWNVLFQKNISSFLDLNISYNGRNSETARTIHTGSVQLKAYF